MPREEEADYQTVGGMVMDTLGRDPSTGDRFEWEGYTFEVLVTPTRNAPPQSPLEMEGT